MMSLRAEKEASSPLLESAGVVLEHAAKRTLLTTSLNKALFYLDLHALMVTGTTVTKVPFVALKAGPVVESYNERLIRPLESAGIAMQDDDDPRYKPVILTGAVKIVHLSDQHVKLARTAATWASKLNATELSLFSHDNPGWIAAWADGDGIGRRINMRLAMQQILDEDPWLKETLTDDERAAFASADDGEAVEW